MGLHVRRRQRGAAPRLLLVGCRLMRAPNDDAILVLLLLVLIVVPRLLQRYRLPGAITSLGLGFGAQQLGLIPASATLKLLSTLGIVALFLFAGLEIDARQLRKDARVLLQFAALWTMFALLTALAAMQVFGLVPRAAMLTALALLTPSTGFILSSIHGGGLTPLEQHAIKTKAIAAELLALAALFLVIQTTSARQLAVASASLAGIVVIIPLAFRFFARVVSPYAPKSEFAFLLGVAVITAIITRELGVYYLLGAFLVGVSAQRFRARLPALSSEKLIDALEAFGSVFIPFYFFVAGAHIDREQTSWWGLAMGLSLLAIFVPLRIAVFAVHRRVALQEAGAMSRRVATALVPTLVFTLVISEILELFAAPDYLVGGLIVYTVLNTLVPAIAMGTSPPEFESLHVSENPPATAVTERR
jgi:Kef-type K+ transport system membrane component KefB